MGCFGISSAEEERQDLEAVQRARERENVMETERHCTDVCALMMMAVCLFILFIGLAYTLDFADIDRLVNGYDDCGNVCGKTNKKYNQWECTGKDMTDKAYMTRCIDIELNITRKMCLNNDTFLGISRIPSVYCFELEGLNEAEMDKYKPLLAKLPKLNLTKSKVTFQKLLAELNDDLRLCWFEIILLLVFATVLTCILVSLLIHLTKFMVWFLLMAATFVLFGLTMWYWYKWATFEDNPERDVAGNATKLTYLFFAVMFTVYIFFHMFMVYCMLTKIYFIIALIKETGKAIKAMPFLMVQPVITVIGLIVACSLFVYFSFLGSSAGILSEHAHNILMYDATAFMLFTLLLNVFMICWITQFIIGCEQMIIALSVTGWYFTRNKNDMKFSLLSSLGILVSYHLGSVALGSMLIAVIQFIRFIVEAMNNDKNNNDSILALISRCILDCLEEIFKYFSRQSYIQTAIYGYPFCRAGKRAFKVITNNIYNIMGILFISDPVFSMLTLVIILTPIAVGVQILHNKEGLNHLWFLILVIGSFSWMAAHCFVSVFQMSIDTIFMDFCEDLLINDGGGRPYYMSKELMDFIKETDRFLPKKEVA